MLTLFQLINGKFIDNLIYKNIIYSLGKESIETNFLLDDNFIYDKNYIVIGYRKIIFGVRYNKFYFEPKIILIAQPINNIGMDENRIVLLLNKKLLIKITSSVIL